MRNAVGFGTLARACVGACLLALGAAGAGEAQTTTGTLRGYVRGAAGESLAGATVAARNTETNQVRQVSTSQAGYFQISALPPARTSSASARWGWPSRRGR